MWPLPFLLVDGNCHCNVFIYNKMCTFVSFTDFSFPRSFCSKPSRVNICVPKLMLIIYIFSCLFLFFCYSCAFAKKKCLKVRISICRVSVWLCKHVFSSTALKWPCFSLARFSLTSFRPLMSANLVLWQFKVVQRGRNNNMQHRAFTRWNS